MRVGGMVRLWGHGRDGIAYMKRGAGVHASNTTMTMLSTVSLVGHISVSVSMYKYAGKSCITNVYPVDNIDVYTLAENHSYRALPATQETHNIYSADM